MRMNCFIFFNNQYLQISREPWTKSLIRNIFNIDKKNSISIGYDELSENRLHRTYV